MRDLGPVAIEDVAEARPIRHERRAEMAVPPRVKLVAVEDQRRPKFACDVGRLDGFYVGLLGFRPERTDAGHVAYRAERCRLAFDLPADATDGGGPFPPVGIRVPIELRRLEKALVEDWRLEVERVTTLWPGSDALDRKSVV